MDDLLNNLIAAIIAPIVIYIPTSSIISKKYYSAEYEFDILHKFILKHFSFFFCNRVGGGD